MSKDQRLSAQVPFLSRGCDRKFSVRDEDKQMGCSAFHFFFSLSAPTHPFRRSPEPFLLRILYGSRRPELTQAFRVEPILQISIDIIDWEVILTQIIRKFAIPVISLQFFSQSFLSCRNILFWNECQKLWKFKKNLIMNFQDFYLLIHLTNLGYRL